MLSHKPCLQLVAPNDIAYDQIVGSSVAAVRREARHRSCFLEDDFMRVQQAGDRLTTSDSDSRCRCRASSGLRDLPFALLDEREQVAVDEVGMRTGESMRQAGIVDFRSPLDQLC